MRILFIGAVEFSAHVFRELISMKADVVGLCTLPHSEFNSDYFDLKPIADNSGIPAIYTLDINSGETLDWIRERNPDVIFCFGWSRLISAPLLALPRLGIVGFHPSALPKNRGRHPLIWALVLGLSETASTFFFMDKGADCGDLISQVHIYINPNDDAGTLYKKVVQVSIEQMRDFLPKLANGSVNRIPQDHSLANVWRKRGLEDGQIDWRMASSSIHNLVRGLTRPYVGAHFQHKDKVVKVWRTEIVMEVPENFEPGKVLEVNENGILVKTGIGGIRLIEIDPLVTLKIGCYL